TIHILSHGAPGCLYLGNSQLNLTNIHNYNQQLQQWPQNILLYGCNVAAGDAGTEFIHKLHQITNATISASTTKTGNAALGGNWQLEVNIPVTNVETFHGTSLLQGEGTSPPFLVGKGARGLGHVFNAHTLHTYQGVLAPTLVGQWDFLSYANAVTVVGSYAYAVGDTLDIIDISNPAIPVAKGSYKISSGRGVQVVGNYAYVADGGSGLQIIDISNPTTPTLKGNYNTSGYAWDVQVVGNYAYVADYSSGLQIIDISNPTTPTLKGNYDTSGIAWGVQVVGNYAYVADWGSGLQIIDISNPSTPTLKGNYDTPSAAWGVQVVGNYAYVADWASGIQIIDISNPTTPTLNGNYDTSNSALGVQVVGNYAYVANDSSGLQIIDVSEFTNKAPTNLTLSTTAQQDIIDADYGEDTIISTWTNLQQNDTINGGLGIDTLVITEGTVNDIISIYTSNTTNQLDIPETTGFGFERFDLSEFIGTVSFFGTAGNDWVKGGTGNDTLIGGDSNDYLNGGTGIDLLVGGKGSDTYVVDNVGDIIAEGLNWGIDTVESSITWTLKANLENLTLTGTTNINGTGNHLNNIITGNTGNNVLTGGLGNDTLIGGTGADTLMGGVGNDSYYVDNTADIITENLNQGNDSGFSTVTYTLSANVENLTLLSGTTAINGTGNDLNNSITGNSGNNALTGGLGNDTLNGGTGADTLVGGVGDDSYFVDNTADIITENSNEGTDSVFSTVTYTLSANVENLTLLSGTTAINGTGNNLSNTITGNTGNNVLTGGLGNDTLNGGTGADTFVGGVGDDKLYLGSDTTVDNVNYVLGDGIDIVYQFVRGVGGDKLNFTGIANFDVIISGTSTLVRVGDGIIDNAGFGTGQLLVTLSDTSGFNSGNVNLNLFGGTFLFS
ncbi:MAG: DUF4347 domain-containing protein, partial [Dolichospermum sp.]